MPILQRDDREVPVSWLTPNPRNVATHSRKQIDKLKRIVERVGFATAVICDDTGLVIAGHLRLQVFRELGRGQVPATILTGLSDVEKRTLMLADNRVARDAGIDRAKLFDEISDLEGLLVEDGLDLAITGYEAPEIDQLAVDFEDHGGDPADEFDPQWEDRPIVTQPGDLFQLGGNRLLCGSCLEDGVLERLMEGRTAAAVVADPPYNLEVASLVGRGGTKHPEFAMASGEMSEEAFLAFLIAAFMCAARVSAPGALQYWFMDWRHVGEFVSAGRTVYDTMVNLVVWAKTNAGMGSFYRSAHELCGVFRVAGAVHRNNVELGRYQRDRSNVWRYASANTFRAGRMDDLRDHPTVKPVAMLADAIKDCTRRGDIVLDPFAGSGSTLLAAERTGRRGYGVEIEPRYVDVALRRLEALTGRDAVHAESGLTWHQLAAERGVDPKQGRDRPRRRRSRS